MAIQAQITEKVLEVLRALYDLTLSDDVPANHEVIEEIERVGLTGFNEDQAPVLILMGTCLRLLCEQSPQTVDEMFDGALAMLAAVERSMDAETLDWLDPEIEDDGTPPAG
jgi:hypothetical protein